MNNTTINIAEYSFSYDETRGILVNTQGNVVPADVMKISEGEFSVLVDGKSYHLFLSRTKNSYTATVNNFIFEIQRETLRDKLTKQLQKEAQSTISTITLRAPMPGLITKLLKKEGSQVNLSEGILVIEAMKMENEIKSTKSGILKKIFVKEKQPVEKNDNLFTIE
ncbi:MAG: biotin/lipoyl-containing protein [Bacteroidota bacterium]